MNNFIWRYYEVRAACGVRYTVRWQHTVQSRGCIVGGVTSKVRWIYCDLSFDHMKGHSQSTGRMQHKNARSKDTITTDRHFKVEGAQQPHDIKKSTTIKSQGHQSELSNQSAAVIKCNVEAKLPLHGQPTQQKLFAGASRERPAGRL